MPVRRKGHYRSTAWSTMLVDLPTLYVCGGGGVYTGTGETGCGRGAVTMGAGVETV